MSSVDDINFHTNKDDLRSENATKKRKRSLTDVHFFYLQLLVMCCLGGLIGYCSNKADLKRIQLGYDNCNNICGTLNSQWAVALINMCEGLNMKTRKYLLVFRPDGRNHYRANYSGDQAQDGGVPLMLSNLVHRICVKHCNVFPNYELVRDRCVLKKRKEVSDRFFGKTGYPDLFEEIAEDILILWKELLFLEVGAFGVSYWLIILFAFFTASVVRLVLYITVLVMLVFTIYIWVLWVRLNRSMNVQQYLPSEIELGKYLTYLILAILSTVATPLLYSIVLINKQKMGAVIQLHKEVVKILKPMIILFLQPALTCLIVCGIIALDVYIFLLIESSGFETRPRPNFYMYQKDTWMILTRWLNIFALLWIIYFIIDCQNVIIAGTISFWYFCRDKVGLGTPICYGTFNLIQYHLGSVSLGSLAGIVLQILKPILILTKMTFKGKYFIGSYCARYAYVEVVIRGLPFGQAGQQARNTFAANDLCVNRTKDVGNLVLNFMKLFVSLMTTAVGLIIFEGQEDILHLWALLTLIFSISYLITSCFISVYQTAIDTIFICVCEDYNNSNGTPPFLSDLTVRFLELDNHSNTNFGNTLREE